MERAQVLKSFTLKSNQATNTMERYERKKKGGELERTPKSRSNRFPSLRGDIDWWKC
jgi:hypothetical protein